VTPTLWRPLATQHESSCLPEGNSNRWSSVVKRKAKSTTAPKGNSATETASVSPDDCKFNVVMHGIEECKKGTPRHVQMGNDTKSASVTIQEVCPDITCQAIRNCVRLGSYIEGCNRPLFVMINHSWQVEHSGQPTQITAIFDSYSL